MGFVKGTGFWKMGVDKSRPMDYCKFNVSWITNLGKRGNCHVDHDQGSFRYVQTEYRIPTVSNLEKL